MTYTINGERLRLDYAAELLAMIVLERIGGAWAVVVDMMREWLESIRPGCRREYQGLTVSRDYPEI